MKQLRSELAALCREGRQGLSELKQIDMLIHIEAAMIAADEDNEDQLKYHLLQIRSESWPWIATQPCPGIHDLLKELHLHRINIERQFENDRPE